MARLRRGLTTKEVEAAKHPGVSARPIRIGDHNGLYLQIATGGSKSWLFRYTLAGKSREMGLGPCGVGQSGLSLAEAREKAIGARALLRQGMDPIDHRTAMVQENSIKRERAISSTFKNVSEAMIDARESNWKNSKHRQQWRNTLSTYVYPLIGDMPVSDVSTDDVLRCLKPIWSQKPETASRIRGRIERVLSYAKALKLRDGENPAIWRGHLSEVLAAPTRIEGKEPKHHPALPWQQIPEFMAELRGRHAVAASALEFAILCASRTGEVICARWIEVNLEEALWIIPAGRMKGKKEHRVALSPAAMDVLKRMQPLSTSPDHFIFPSHKRSMALSQMAMLMLLRRMNPILEAGKARWHDGQTGEPITTHGFRSTFRDWVGEATVHPTDIAEAALAHKIQNKTEAAYARGDLLIKRRALMLDWANYCGKYN